MKILKKVINELSKAVVAFWVLSVGMAITAWGIVIFPDLIDFVIQKQNELNGISHWLCGLIPIWFLTSCIIITAIIAQRGFRIFKSNIMVWK